MRKSKKGNSHQTTGGRFLFFFLMDAEDSGTWQPTRYITVVGDHAEEWFMVLKDVIPGESKLYLQTGTQITTFICVEKGIGANTVTAILDEKGENLTRNTEYSLLSYCCANASGSKIYYVYWIPT